MGAHVFIVNKDTFQIARDRCFVSVFQEDTTKPLAEKTRADILADLSCLRIGDKIFFYEVECGFHGIYKVVSLPFIEFSDVYGIGEYSNVKLEAPYRALIRPRFFLQNSVPEKRVFGLKESSTQLRSIFYKKALGRGKAITHLFPEEEKFLTELLFKANDSELKIEPYNPGKKQDIIFDLETKENGELKYEKILEGWLIQNLDNPESNCSIFLGDISDIESFSNYAPINISGGNVDIMVYHKRKINGNNIRYKITIIELKKGSIGIESIYEIEQYVKWLSENIANSDAEMIQPVLIGRKIKPGVVARCKYYSISTRKPILIEYSVDYSNYNIKFNEYENDE